MKRFQIFCICVLVALSCPSLLGVSAQSDLNDNTTDFSPEVSSTTTTVSDSTTISDETSVDSTTTQESTDFTEISSSTTDSITPNVTNTDGPIEGNSTTVPPWTSSTEDTYSTSTSTTEHPPTTESSSTTTDNPTSVSDLITSTVEITTTLAPLDPPEEGKVSTWAVVLISILISFAIIFTGLYFLRKLLIKRRRDDQRRLLRGSVSSEGFFYGDGSGANHSSRFHDSI